MTAHAGRLARRRAGACPRRVQPVRSPGRTTMDKDLDGKTALVTGGGRGIGRGIALRLGAAGALVAVNYAADAEAAQATVAEIEAGGGHAFALQAKVGAPGAVEVLTSSLTAELLSRTGEAGLDILVNNIGGAEYG